MLLSGVNYINHLSCYRRERLLALGGLRAGYEGSQDYDLLLRYLRDLVPEEIKHLPYPGLSLAAQALRPFRRNLWIGRPRARARRWPSAIVRRGGA